ncbi:MAG TPA: type II toxin-antitoxin system RelE/ParE family toxin [Thermoanaerobaculia bacterium]|nr:type II toxin-antitoxin system RelE/ParE family toxin [Thermoanaerobaculia bacterium]
MKVVWSPLAIERAHEEAAFIARDKPAAALRWLEGLFKIADRLESFPRSGHVVPEINMDEFREIAYRSHRVIYHVRTEMVSILTVRRSKRLLDPKEIAEATDST